MEVSTVLMRRKLRSIGDTPIGVHPNRVMSWITKVMSECDHNVPLDGLCSCQIYLSEIITFYATEIDRRHDNLSESMSCREMLAEIDRQVDLETDLIRAEERITELNRRVRDLTELLRVRVAETYSEADRTVAVVDLERQREESK